MGFNLLRFDYTVLRPYTTRDLHQLPTLDILRDLERKLGRRVKLDSCARATLGVNKSADGIQSVQWFRAGHIDKVIRYCEQDVDIVRQLHEYGRANKHIYITDGSLRRPVKVNW